ncbi:MAG TPA: molybdopterin cofactor-binding domain-containing protein, partial [Hyphomicrobiales bacterium]|nr:molybdopterin cofactor-binding domain-containing protein [Hyphomicrobiales bacterium]
MVTRYGIGQPIRRVEDKRFLTGRGTYVDDIQLPHMTYGMLVLSPHAHARIRKIDTAAAKAAPGVLAVVTGADLQADGIGGIFGMLPEDVGGPKGFRAPRPLLASDKVRHVGDRVAFVVAETLEQARDAAELVEVDYRDEPAVADIAEATRPGAPRVWDEAPGNIVFDWSIGDEAATEAAFRDAAHVTRVDLVNNRVVVASMEPRNALGAYDAGEDRYTLYTGSQGVHSMRGILAGTTLQVPPEKVRVVTYDVGGGFGMKAYVYPEHGLVLWASKRIGRPV